MKRYVRMSALLLVVFLTVSLLFGCSNSGGDSDSVKEAASTADTQNTPAPEVVKEDPNEKKFEKLDNGNISIMYWISEAQNKQNKEEKPDSYDDVWDSKEAFEKKYGGKIDFVITPWGDCTAKLIAMLNSGDVPDVVQLHNQNFPIWPAKNALQPITDYLSPESECFNPVVTKAYTFSGKNYALGTSVAPIIIYYNKTLFEENGVKDPGTYYKEGKWDWEAFRTCGKEMTYDDVTGFAWWDMHNPFLSSNGGLLMRFNEDGSFSTDLNTPAGIEALQFYQDGMLKDKYISTTINGSDFVAAFENGKVAMTAEYVLGSYNKTKYKTGVVPFPTGPKGKKDVGPGGASGWGIPTGSKNPQGAAAYIYMMSKMSKENKEKSLYAQYEKEDVDMYLRCMNNLNYSPDSGLSKFFDINWVNLQDLKKGTPVATVATNFSTQLENAAKETLAGK